MSYYLLELPELLADRFYRLADRWKAQPFYSPWLIEKVQHPDYQAIIAMGWEAVPFILRELTIERDHWFVALRTITGENPVPEDCYGNLPKMTARWLKWGKARGLI